MKERRKRKKDSPAGAVLLGVAVLCLLLFLYNAVLRLALRPWIVLPPAPRHSLVLFALPMLFGLFHAWYALGWRHLATFLVLSLGLSWGFEELGVTTGSLFGRYHYTTALGPKVGHVPVVIPLLWFSMLYPSYVIANLILAGRVIAPRRSWVGLAWLSLLSAMVMTAWDLVIDPIFSSSSPAAGWVWEEEGAYFGVPLQNFLGWLLTALTINLLYRLFERWRRPHPVGPLTPAIAALPPALYLVMMLSNVLPGEPRALWIIGPLAMGLPVVAAAGRLREVG